MPVRNQRGRSPKDVRTGSESSHKRAPAEQSVQAGPTAGSARRPGPVRGAQERPEERGGLPQVRAKTSERIPASRELPQQGASGWVWTRTGKHLLPKVETAAYLGGLTRLCPFLSFIWSTLSSLLLSLGHSERLLLVQPALPPGASELLLWRGPAPLQPPSRGRPAQLPVQPLLPGQGEQPTAPGPPSAQVSPASFHHFLFTRVGACLSWGVSFRS